MDVVFHLGLQYVRSIVALGGTPTEADTDAYIQRVESPLQVCQLSQLVSRSVGRSVGWSVGQSAQDLCAHERFDCRV